MIPGLTFIYECPACSHILKKGSLASGNTFGAKLYSDGKVDASMFSKYPDLTKCKKCNTLFWLSKLKSIGYYEWYHTARPEWKIADKAEFLELDDYFRAIDSGMAKTPKQELYIRHKIWWAYNDKIRSGKNIFDDENDELKWNDNLNKLLLFIKPSNPNQKFMISEINRNLGNFDKCIEILQSIRKKDMAGIKEKLLYECYQKNRWLVRLN